MLQENEINNIRHNSGYILLYVQIHWRTISESVEHKRRQDRNNLTKSVYKY